MDFENMDGYEKFLELMGCESKDKEVNSQYTKKNKVDYHHDGVYHKTCGACGEVNHFTEDMKLYQCKHCRAYICKNCGRDSFPKGNKCKYCGERFDIPFFKSTLFKLSLFVIAIIMAWNGLIAWAGVEEGGLEYQLSSAYTKLNNVYSELVNKISEAGETPESDKLAEEYLAYDMPNEDGTLDYGRYKINRSNDGTYLIVGNGQMAILSDEAEDGLLDVEFYRNTCYVKVKDGDELEFNDGLAYPLESAPLYYADGDGINFSDGEYLVGRDIKPGTYEYISNSDANNFININYDCRDRFNNWNTTLMGFVEPQTFEVIAGEFVQVKGCDIKFISE